MRKLVFFISLCFISPAIFSQINTERYDSPSFYLREFKEIEISNEEVMGSLYKYQDFIQADVYLKIKDEPQKYYVNYNMHTDKIDFKSDDKIYEVSNSELIIKLVVESDCIYYYPYYSDEELKMGFLFKIHGDSIQLFKKEKVRFIPAQEARNIYDNDEPAKFLNIDPDYYLAVNKEPAFLIKNKKSFKNKFSNETEIFDFLKAEKIDFKSEQDLIKLIDFINR